MGKGKREGRKGKRGGREREGKRRGKGGGVCVIDVGR